MPELHDRLAFFLATDALKETRRANWIYSRQRHESVAEHSWHALLLAMLFADAAPDGINHNHVRDLLIVHDLVEVYAGDTSIWNDEHVVNEAARREMVAGERLMAMLPDDVLPRFDPLWREFQAQESEEARFARAIDTLHPVIMAWAEGAQGHGNVTITPASVLERKRPTIETYPHLWGCLLHILQGAVDRGMLDPDDVVVRGTGDEIEVSPGLHAYLERLDFFLVADKLKEVQRANRIHIVSRFETVAEHSWHAMLLAMLFRDIALDGTDHDRVGDLLIIHDLVEVYAGDTPLWNTELQQSEVERELDAAHRLLGLLPDIDRERFEALIHEFLVQQTSEARFARAIDSLHPLVISWTDGGFGHPEHAFTPTWLIERKRPPIEPFPALWDLAFSIFQGAVDRGMLPPDEMVQRRDR